MTRAFARLAAVLALCLVGMASVAQATPPLPLDLAGVSLTIDVPETYAGGTPLHVSGRLLAYFHLPIVVEVAQPVSGQEIRIYADGVPDQTVTTNSEGIYGADLLFDALAPTTRSIRAVAFEGSAIETQSRTATTRLARTLIGLTIQPSSLSLAPGGSASLRALGEFDDGRVEDVTGRVLWTSSDAQTATVGNTGADKGLVTGIQPGSATITGAMDGLAAAAGVDVA